MHKVIAGLLWFAVAVAPGACGGEDAKYQAHRKKREAEGQARFEELKASFSKVVAAWPADGGAARCPDDALAKDPADKLVVLAGWDALRVFVDDLWSKEPPRAFMYAHTLLDQVDPHDLPEAIAAAELLAKRPWIVVYRESELVEGKLGAIGTFTAGHARGRAVVFDVRTAAPLCGFDVAATNSATIDYRRTQSVESQVAVEEASNVSVDLTMQVRAAIDAGLLAASKVLTISPLSTII